MNTKIKVAVCDDEGIMLEIIEEKLRQAFAQIKFKYYDIHLFQNGMDLLKSQNRFDIILLDIEMPDMDGLSLAKRLHGSKTDPLIIFITCHRELMEWGFHVRAFRYLTKPINDNSFNEAIKNALNEIMVVDTILVSDSTKRALLDVRELIYVESLGEGCCFYTNTSKYIRNEPLKYWIDRLPKKEFIQTHRAFVINIRYITNIEPNIVNMKNGSRVPVSVRRRKALNDALHQYLRRKLC